MFRIARSYNKMRLMVTDRSGERVINGYVLIVEKKGVQACVYCSPLSEKMINNRSKAIKIYKEED